MSKKGYKKVPWLFGKEIEIPEEWKYDRIKNICSKITSGGTPNRGNPEYYEGQIIWIKSGELNNNFISDSDEKITDIGLIESSAKLFRKDTILIAMYGATIGKTAIIKKEATTNQAICAILPENTFDSFYLQQLLISMKNILISFGMGAGQPNINQEIIKRFHIALPIIQEQQKIASILSGVDALIENTQKVIEKSERLKKSLMQNLLVRGINHKKFKKVPWLFGKEIEIPEEWEIKSLKEIGEIIGGGTPDSTNDNFWNGKILWAIPTDITKLQVNQIEDTEKKITKEGLDNSSANLLSKGTILITTRATIGKCAITTKSISTNQGFQNIICNDNVDNYFIFYLINQFHNNLLRLSQGTTFLEINKSQMKKVIVPIPDLISEQTKIASILSGVDAVRQCQNVELIILRMKFTIHLILFVTILYYEFYNAEKNIHHHHNSR